MKIRAHFLSLVCLFAVIITADALPLSSDDFDNITIGGSQAYSPPLPDITPDQPDMYIAAIQVLMDRVGISPGVIDGRDNRRFRKAFSYLVKHRPQLAIQSVADRSAIESALEKTGGAPFVEIELSAEDIKGPFTRDIPALYINQAKLPEIGFTSPREQLAERFHADEDFLQSLNPDTDFQIVGTTIAAPYVGRDLNTRVVRIVADKKALKVAAFGADGELVAAYPASIGSASTPSPSGTHTVRNKAQNPKYTYDPSGSAQPGLSKGLVLLPPGPNGPVGNAWIGLSKRTYGIHGTPEPSLIGLAESVGCVRLTNWDALELARLVNTGVEVTFTD